MNNKQQATGNRLIRLLPVICQLPVVIANC